MDACKRSRNLCCVCSANGEYDIFNRIPVHVHSAPIEFRFWPDSIAAMIASVSGIVVSSSSHYIFFNSENYKSLIIDHFVFSRPMQIDHHRRENFTAENLHHLRNIFEACGQLSEPSIRECTEITAAGWCAGTVGRV